MVYRIARRRGGCDGLDTLEDVTDRQLGHPRRRQVGKPARRRQLFRGVKGALGIGIPTLEFRFPRIKQGFPYTRCLRPCDLQAVGLQADLDEGSAVNLGIALGNAPIEHVFLAAFDDAGHGLTSRIAGTTRHLAG